MTYLNLFSDVLLLGASAGVAVWCGILSARIRAFDAMDRDADGTVAALTAQADALRTALATAEDGAADRAAALRDEVAAADDRIGRLQLLLAGIEDAEADLEAAMAAHPPETAVELALAMPSFRPARPDQIPGRFQR